MIKNSCRHVGQLSSKSTEVFIHVCFCVSMCVCESRNGVSDSLLAQLKWSAHVVCVRWGGKYVGMHECVHSCFSLLKDRRSSLLSFCTTSLQNFSQSNTNLTNHSFNNREMLKITIKPHFKWKCIWTKSRRETLSETSTTEPQLSTLEVSRESLGCFLQATPL